VGLTGILFQPRGRDVSQAGNLSRVAEPLSPIVGSRSTENRLRHYERLAAQPEGFILLGDAVCALNPIYGQGMSAAALGAVKLDQTLREFGRPRCRQFQREWQPVEPPANLHHSERILRGEGEVGANGLGALDQQVDGGHLGQGVQGE
jgi:hypothetical protein